MRSCFERVFGERVRQSGEEIFHLHVLVFLTRDGDEEALEVDDVQGFDVFGEIAGVEV